MLALATAALDRLGVAGAREHGARNDDDAHERRRPPSLGGNARSARCLQRSRSRSASCSTIRIRQAEDSYLAQLYDPSSSLYQQFLDPDTFNQQFGVPATTVQAAQSWLSGAGLAGDVGRRRDDVSARERNGGAGLGGIRHAAQSLLGRRSHVLRERRRSDGAGVAADLDGARPERLRVLRHAACRHDRNADDHDRGADRERTFRRPASLTPQTLWSIYDQPSTNLGNGQTMAIFGWGVTDGVVNDLRSFEQENELPQVPITTKSYGSTSTPDTSGDGATVEWELDTQASTGMAPDVTGETLYFGHHNTDADILAAMTAWVNDRKGPMQASASFGECENIPGGRARDRRRRPRRPRRRDAEAGRDRGAHALLVDRRHRLVVPDRPGRARTASRRRCTRRSTTRRRARTRSPSAAPC